MVTPKNGCFMMAVAAFTSARLMARHSRPIPAAHGKSTPTPIEIFYASQKFFRKNFPNQRVIQMAWSFGKVPTKTWTHNATFSCEFKLKTLPEGVRMTCNPVAEILCKTFH